MKRTQGPTWRGSHRPKTGQYEHQKTYVSVTEWNTSKKLKSKSLYIKSWKVTGHLQKILRNQFSLKTDIQMERTKQIKYKLLNIHSSHDPKISQWLRLQCAWKHSELGRAKQGIAVVSAIAAARKLSPLLITLAHESNLSSDLCAKYFSKYLTLFSPLILT